MSKTSPFMTPALHAMSQNRMRDQAMADLLDMHSRFLKAIEGHSLSVAEVKTYANDIVKHAERIHSLPPGEKGEPGDPGEPAEAPDLATIVQEVLKVMPKPKDGVSPDPQLVATQVITRLKQPKDGKDAVINEDAIIEKLIEKLKTGKHLTKEHINGFVEEMSSYRNQLARKQAGQHGGGDTVEAGNGVTITTTAAGKKRISAGASGTAVYNEVVAGSGTAFTLAHTPDTGTLRLYANGQRLTVTVDYTLVGAALTMVTSWATGTVLADYSYT